MTHEWHYSTDPSLGDLIVEVQDSLWPLATFTDPQGAYQRSAQGEFAAWQDRLLN